MEDHAGEALHDRAQQVLVPLDLEPGVQAALHQDLDPADVHHLLDLLEDGLARQNVAAVLAGLAVEVAELAADPADVGVVDVAPDDVGDARLGVLLPAHVVGQ
jgi:hypothetical protein